MSKSYNKARKKSYSKARADDKKTLIILVAIAAVIAIVFLSLSVVALIKRDRYYDKLNSLEFTPPPFDPSAVVGDPAELEGPEKLGYGEIYDPSKVAFITAICGVFDVNENNEADVYFANPTANTLWIKLRVYDAKQNIVCETGLIRPGEYIKTITFDRPIKNGEELTVKVMSYVPDEYTSGGVFNLKPYVTSEN